VDKKTSIIIILVLCIIIIGLIWFGFSRGASFDTAIKQIQGQRDSLIRSSTNIKYENRWIRKESAELRANNIQSEENNLKTEEDNSRLEAENKQYRELISEIRIGSRATSDRLVGYGRITDDFADFLRRAEISD